MNWLENIEVNTLLNIELKNGKEFSMFFTKVSNGIVEGVLTNGRIKKFKEENIEGLEELVNDNQKVDYSLISTVDNNLPHIEDKESVSASEETEVNSIVDLPVVPIAFLDKIENNVLPYISFNSKEDLREIKDKIPEIHTKLLSILNSFENAIKINEIDLKYNRTPKILKQINLFLKEYQEEGIDLMLAYILQSIQMSYFDFFGSSPDTLYCLKNDISYCNSKDIKYGFILAEKLFNLYYLNEETEKEWYYLIKKSTIFMSIEGLKLQEEYIHKLDSGYAKLIRESLDYLANNFKISSTKVKDLHDGIEYLIQNIIPNPEYQELKSIKSLSTVFSDKEYTDKEILLSFLPANGIIEKYDISEGKGYIRDKIGFEYFFNNKLVADKKVLERLQEDKHAKFEIFFLASTKFGKKIADRIKYPIIIKAILDEIDEMIKNKSFYMAEVLLKQILSIYPKFQPAKMRYDKIKNTHALSMHKENTKKVINMNSKLSHYKRARQAKDNKDYKIAIEYFEIALENNERLESTIKDLAITYYETGNHAKEKELLVNYAEKLPKNITSYNFLENQYYALGEHKNALKYIDILLKHSPSSNKTIFLLGRKATIYLKIGKEKEAQDILKDILKRQPENIHIEKLLEQLKEGEFNKIDMEDMESYFSMFSSGGLSNFIDNVLSSYEEYTGVPPAIRESKNFQKETLRSLRRLIDTAGRARPKERAGYLLSEAKLMQILEPDKDNLQRGILAKYCNAMALNHISMNSPRDTIRFYYLEAFLLEEIWSSLSRQVSLYILTYAMSYQELLAVKDYSVLADVKEIFKQTQNHEIVWNAILDMFIVNRTIAKELTQNLFQDRFLKELSLDFLGANKNDDIGMNNYVKYWDEARERRKIMYDNFSASIKALTNIDKLEKLESQMRHVLSEEIHSSEWLSQSDRHRLKVLLEIHNMVNDYLKQNTFDDKERVKDYIVERVAELSSEIEKLPTKISYDSYVPLLKNIERLLIASFNDVVEVSLPEVTIKTLIDSVVVNNKKVSLQLYIENSKNSSPVSNVEIMVVESDNISFITGETEIYETIRGGHGKIIQITITISDTALLNLVADMQLLLSYKTRGDEKLTKKTVYIPIQLYKSEEFVKIRNSYASVAEGGPVKDESMFFGRDEYITNTVNALISDHSKSIIIYGQKRSGKSSVLYHLKKRLQTRENAFCVSFSMGDIIQGLSVSQVTFYYTILAAIEDELEILGIEGEDVPLFQKPSIESMEKYPAIVFNEALKEFIKMTKNVQVLKNKKLVIMIDEFTYIYSSIKKGTLSPDFMKTWKAFIEKDYFSAVLVGQDVAPKFKMEYSNEFGVTEDQRLTYLSENDAKELIEKPIWDEERNASRYVGEAISRIIEYTACNPYYLQMFCSRVVDYMNKKKAISITESDIENVAYSFIEGANSLPPDKFENLFTAGDADTEAFNLEDVEMVLKQIAYKSSMGSCTGEDISIEGKTEEEIIAILDDLKSREVIEEKERFYKIKVGLFQKWLLK